MSGRPSQAVRRKKQFLESLDSIQALRSDLAGLGGTGRAWHGDLWKQYAAVEMLAARAYSEWEHFAHEIIIIELARDTSVLAASTGLSIRPQRVSYDLAEALLTARRYLEFPNMQELIKQANRWLAGSPFNRLSAAEIRAADDLRIARNFIVHRSRQSQQLYAKLLKKRGVAVVPPGEFLSSSTPARIDDYLALLRSAASKCA